MKQNFFTYQNSLQPESRCIILRVSYIDSSPSPAIYKPGKEMLYLSLKKYIIKVILLLNVPWF
jgi:hypothetical protein